MIGLLALLATTAYNTGTVLVFAHAFVPLPPLLWLADKANAKGDALETVRERAQRSKDYR